MPFPSNFRREPQVPPSSSSQRYPPRVTIIGGAGKVGSVLAQRIVRKTWQM